MSVLVRVRARKHVRVGASSSYNSNTLATHYQHISNTLATPSMNVWELPRPTLRRIVPFLILVLILQPHV